MRAILIFISIIGSLVTLKWIQFSYSYLSYLGEMGGMKVAMALGMVNGLVMGEVTVEGQATFFLRYGSV